MIEKAFGLRRGNSPGNSGQIKTHVPDKYYMFQSFEGKGTKNDFMRKECTDDLVQEWIDFPRKPYGSQRSDKILGRAKYI